MATPVQINDLSSGARFVRGGSCRMLGFSVLNPSTGAAYVQCFDTLAAPTVGTTAPAWSLGVPTAATIQLQTDVFFRDGLWVAATTTDDGSTAPGTALNVSLQMS